MFKTQLPYLSRVPAQSKEAGDSLGPFADQQMAGSKEFLNKWLAELRDTIVHKLQDYRSFDGSTDLTVDPATDEIIPNTGKDPFYNSGPEYLQSFLRSYDLSSVVEDKVRPGTITNIVKEAAEKVKEFPGADGTRIS